MANWQQIDVMLAWQIDTTTTRQPYDNDTTSAAGPAGPAAQLETC